MQHARTKLSPIAFAVGCALGGLPAAASAAEEAAARQPDAVVVSARKPLYEVRDVNLGAFGARDAFDVPLSIHSYSSTLIDNQRARTLNDVLKNDPAVQNASIGGAYDHVAIRGFAIDWTNTMRRDGQALAPYQDVPLENVERMDVLKGPSGFLYGYNSPGGTVNHVLKRPTATSFVSATGELREHDGRYAHLDAGGRLGDGSPFGYRLNVAREKVGDFRHGDDLSRTFAGVAFDWKPGPDALLRIDADAQDKDLAAQPVIGPQRDGRLPPAIDSRTLLGQPWLQYRTRTRNVGARFDHAFDEQWSFTAQASRSVNKRLAAFPDVYEVRADGEIVSGDLYIAPGQRFRATSAQVFVSGKFATAAIGHELVAGLSRRDDEARDGGFVMLPITVGNIFRPVYSPPAALPAAPAKNISDSRQSSLFISDLLTLSDAWQLVLGARHIRYVNEFRRPAAAADVDRRNSTVPSVGAVYKPARGVMAYASYAQGLERGGVAPFNAANAGEWMKPVKSRQVELGAKAEVGTGLAIGAALFEIDKGLEYVDSRNVYVQDGRQRHRGIELTAHGRATDALSVVAGFALLDAVQARTGDARTTGKRPPNVPRAQGSVFLDYSVPGMAGLSLHGGVFYVGARALDSVNSVDVPSYARLDLGARYVTRIGGRKTVLRANVENLADRRYWAAASYASVYPGKPRTAGVSLQVEF